MYSKIETYQAYNWIRKNCAREDQPALPAGLAFREVMARRLGHGTPLRPEGAFTPSGFRVRNHENKDGIWFDQSEIFGRLSKIHDVRTEKTKAFLPVIVKLTSKRKFQHVMIGCRRNDSTGALFLSKDVVYEEMFLGQHFLFHCKQLAERFTAKYIQINERFHRTIQLGTEYRATMQHLNNILHDARNEFGHIETLSESFLKEAGLPWAEGFKTHIKGVTT